MLDLLLAGTEMNVRVRVVVILSAALPWVVGCGSTVSTGQAGSGASCYTLNVPATTYDPTGADECEFLITTSGPAQCETMNGIMANQAGSCPAAGIVGCCVTEIGNEGAVAGTLAGVCYYNATFASTGKSGCNGPNNTWQTTVP